MNSNSSKNILLNTSLFSKYLINDPLTLIDGGSRGDLFAPFDQVHPSILCCIRFEPDADAQLVADSNDVIVNKALWNKAESLSLHIAYEPTVSSVMQPNIELISEFMVGKKLEVRKTKSKVEIQGSAIDPLVAQNKIPAIDFIKLDVHGCEYESIEGAAQQMKNNVLGVLAETWVFPFHHGQKTDAEFEVLLQKDNFFPFEKIPTGADKRNTLGSDFHKPYAFKYDTLSFIPIHFLKQGQRIKTTTQALKLIGIAQLFGHIAYAIQLNQLFFDQSLLSQSEFTFNRQFLFKQDKLVEKYGQKIIAKLQRFFCKFY